MNWKIHRVCILMYISKSVLHIWTPNNFWSVSIVRKKNLCFLRQIYLNNQSKHTYSIQYATENQPHRSEGFWKGNLSYCAPETISYNSVFSQHTQTRTNKHQVCQVYCQQYSADKHTGCVWCRNSHSQPHRITVISPSFNISKYSQFTRPEIHKAPTQRRLLQALSAHHYGWNSSPITSSSILNTLFIAL